MDLKRAMDGFLGRHFFRLEPAQSLSLFRFLYCAALVVFLLTRAARHQAIHSSVAWYPIPLFDYFQISLMSAECLTGLRWLLLTALTLTALGCWTRTSAAISCLGYFLYMGTIVGFCRAPENRATPHDMNIVVMILFILSLAPGTAVWGIDGFRKRGWKWRVEDTGNDRVSAWPSQLIKLTLALAYFGAGYCKVVQNPLWADGTTLQCFLLRKFMLYDISIGYFLAQHYWLCLLIGVLTLVLELSFFLVVFSPRLTWPYVIAGLSFHTGILMTMNINFLIPFGFTYLIFLDWPTILRITAALRRVGNWLGRKRIVAAVLRRGEEVRNIPDKFAGDTLWGRACIAGVTAFLLACIYWRVESWPFTDYSVFHVRRTYASVSAYRVAGVDQHGRMTWVPEWEATEDPATYRNRRLIRVNGLRGKAGLESMLQEFARGVPPAWRDYYTKLVVVKRKLDLSAIPNGRFEVIDTPVVEVSLRES